MTRTPRVVRNDWSRVPVPQLAGWRPTLTVSVIVPAFQCQQTLDLTLAALSRQTYPAELLEVVVVDDGSEPALVLPPLRPDRTRLIRLADSTAGWGRAYALAQGAARSSGEILHWLDADMVAFPDHVAAQARWHHLLPYAVTLGYKRFVEPAAGGSWPEPGAVVAAWERAAAGELFGGDEGEPHTYVERYIAQTDQLRSADHLAFRIHVGATAALRRELYDAAGGFDVELRLGEDTEFGYRLAQAGAVFVPEPAARSWHLGRTQVMRARAQVSRYNQPFFADRIPYPRHWRKVGGTSWSVPLAEVVVPATDAPLEQVRAAVDSVLRGTESDVRVHLVGPWQRLDRGRVRVLVDPVLDLQLLAATYRGEPRVRLVTEPPEAAFPAPYLLELPAAYGLKPDGLRSLIAVADRHQVGLVQVDTPGAGSPARLWRTAAVSRSRWVREPDESLVEVVSEVFGRRDATAEAAGLVDLTGWAAAELAAGIPAAANVGRRAPRLAPSTVEVGGVRSWLRATAVVAWLVARRMREMLRFGRR
ncbi:glycosyltransferase [Natronosporangium hydrolyticum]|uniref:Glycosyltransferase n=1 Tax=Natronosporangium hydrolyticum TaxID=2811111 RepID=A0A895YIL7_9ACTN|nr:glycosyltransferase [Natronosporangium hydrolyticum]QSB14426.1 glycosyltransferase [Natronosporangium hydrolyticum]